VPDVSVVVPSHGAARSLASLVDGLTAQTLAAERFEVIVVDTGADGSWRVLERALGNPHFRRVRGPLSGGPAAKRNAGARVARGGLLAFVDADCVPTPGWLEAGLRAAAGGADVVQGRTEPPDWGEWSPFAHTLTVGRDVGLHETCNIFYRRALFERLGGFRLSYYRRYGVPFGEDAELGWRARRAGARYVFASSAVVHHPVGPVDMRRHLREQWLARAFPVLVRDVPELRDTLFYRRLFLSSRSAAFAAAVMGLALSRASRAGGLLALPYLGRLRADLPTLRAPVETGREAVRWLVSDATLAAALWHASIRARNPVL
jgi:glycosyltransferase involved in cell wall biosynthesis